MATPSSHTDKDSAGKLETSDANFKSVMLSGIGLLGIMVLGLLISWGVYVVFVQGTEAPGTPPETFTEPAGAMPPGPNLQPDPHSVLVAMRRVEDSVLTTYGWVNRDSGIVRLPIEQAMELVARRGLPSRQAEDKKR